jgi:hypothetical protein
MKTANDGVPHRNIPEAERISDMEQQPNSRRMEYIATGTRVVGPLVLKAVEARYPKYSVFARLGLRALEGQIEKRSQEASGEEPVEE